MVRSAWVWAAAAAVGMLLSGGAARAGEGRKVEVLTDACLIQSFEDQDVFAKKPDISALSGVPEECEVEVWDTALYGRGKPAADQSGIACRIVPQPKTHGASALEARFARDDRALRVSLRNHLDKPLPGNPPYLNGLGWFDALRADIHNPARQAVTVEVRLLGGFAVTDKSLPLSAVKTLTLQPGWNSPVLFTSEESSAVLVDPYDATCVEFRVPGAKDATLTFDNFRLERESVGKNLAACGKCFDFGVDYLTWPGFAYGSVPYDDARGYGFTAGTSLTHGGDMHVMNDLLTRDGFIAPATFRAKLPNGRYKVVSRTGNYWARRDIDLNIEIKAEGKRVYYRPRLSEAEQQKFKFAHERTDHGHRDFDLWGAYEDGTYFRQATFDAEVADGALDLEFLLPPLEPGQRAGGQSVWNYLILYPADQQDAVAGEIDWLNEKLRRIYNKVSHAPFGRAFALYNREEVICPEEYLWPDLAEARRKALKPSPEETARGYLHFLRHHHDLLTPDSVPRPDEVSDRIERFGSPGETVSWAVGLYPLRDLKQAAVRLGDFHDAAGKTVIRGSSAEVMLVSYRPMTPVTSAHAEPFNYPGPGVLIPPEPLEVPSHFPRQFWMSLPIAPDAPPGLYRAGAEVSVAGKRTSTVTVVLRVLPFALDAPSGVTFAVADSRTSSVWPDRGFPELDFYARMGLNTLWFGGTAEQHQAMDDQARKRGLKVEPVSDRYQNWRWPENYRDAVIRRLVAQGKAVSFQPTHTGYREGRRVRFTCGFWLWRSAIRHRVIQTQPNACERVYYAHAGHAKFGPCHYLFPSVLTPGLLLPGPSWYDVRDGINDWRYIQTLQNAVHASESEGKVGPPVQAGQKYLEELRAALNPNLDYYYFERKRTFNHVDRFGLNDSVWPGQRYEMERWELARHAAAVKGAAMASSAAPRPGGGGGVILHSEYFGPFWVDERQMMYLNADRQGEPDLLAEAPKTLVGRDGAAVLARMLYPSDRTWQAVLKDSAGKELARQAVGLLPRWKTRWVLRTAHLPAGRYVLEVLPADGGPMDRPARAEITILPGIE